MYVCMYVCSLSTSRSAFQGPTKFEHRDDEQEVPRPQAVQLVAHAYTIIKEEYFFHIHSFKPFNTYTDTYNFNRFVELSSPGDNSPQLYD